MLANYSQSPNQSQESLIDRSPLLIGAANSERHRSLPAIKRETEPPSPAVLAKAASLIGGYCAFEPSDCDSDKSQQVDTQDKALIDDSKASSRSVELPEPKISHSQESRLMLANAQKADDLKSSAENSPEQYEHYSKSFERGRCHNSKVASQHLKRTDTFDLTAETAESSNWMHEEEKEEPNAPTEFSSNREARLYYGRGYQRPWSKPA